MIDPFELNVLDPQTTTFFHTKGGLLAMRINDTEFVEVSLHHAFPFSHPHQYITVRNTKGEEFGILERLDQLNLASQKAVNTALKLQYLTPQVMRIDRIVETPGMWVWHLRTTIGTTRFAMRNLHEYVQNPAPGRLILTDYEGNRAEIADINQLDAHSRKQLNRVL